jgi:protein SCO1
LRPDADRKRPIMTMQRRLLLQSAAVLPWAAPALAQTPPRAAGELPWPEVSPREQVRRRYFPDIRLRTHLGQQVRLYEDLIKDKVVMINFIYTYCSDGTCPVTTYNLTQVQKLLKDRVGRDIFMYSITLDPENDTPELLNRYAKSFHTGPGWLFLRAEPNETLALRKSLGFYERDAAADAKKSSHVAMIRIGNEPRQLWATTSAMSAPPVIVRSVMLAQPQGGALLG